MTAGSARGKVTAQRSAGESLIVRGWREKIRRGEGGGGKEKEVENDRRMSKDGHNVIDAKRTKIDRKEREGRGDGEAR